MKYKLFATDMDGTALNTKKELTPRTVAAMEKAAEQGKTGRDGFNISKSLDRPQH